MSGCRKAARPGTLYCSNECILKHAKESLNLLHKDQEKPDAHKDAKDENDTKTKQDAHVCAVF